MGEIADDIVEGRCCDICGMYFAGDQPNTMHEHGHPATCRECWRDLSKAEKKYHQKAQRDTI